ncbi:MAG: EamA family transporter [Anaerolineae bacterium]|nr:EamA family transporter [Anaerolineae bacterium]NUQ05993.1 EamA family transporter [Anaerolineae bacterium]
MQKPPARWLILAAFIAVYLIWGSSYIGIAFASETIPPFMMMASRLSVAGVALFVLAWRSGAKMPTRRQWRTAVMAGIPMFVLNAGAIAYSEARLGMPSGIAAVLLASMPLWMVLINWLRPGGTPPTGLVIAGIAIGFVGIVLLSAPEAGMPALNPVGVIAILMAAFCWAFGSIYLRGADMPASAPLTTGMQLITGGTGLFIVSLFSGEPAAFDPARVSALSLGATIYLAIFNSFIGFSAYVFLMRHVSPAKVATYAYVNPVVAVILGALLANEPVTLRTVIAGGIILLSVFLITLQRLPRFSRLRLAQAAR